MASGINIEQGVPKFLPDLLKNDDEAQGCGWCKGKVPSTSPPSKKTELGVFFYFL